MSQLFSRDASNSKKRSPQVRVSRSTYSKFVLRRVLKVIGYGAIALVVVYFALAATLIRFVPTTSGAGPVLVKNITFAGGILPPGETVLVDRAEPQEDDLMVHLQQATLPAENAAVVKVVAGPYGKVTWQPPGVVAVDGEITDVYYPDEPSFKYLEDQYLAECVSGACTPGEGLIFPREAVYGSVVSLDTLTNK